MIDLRKADNYCLLFYMDGENPGCNEVHRANEDHLKQKSGSK
jgi:hypothetical protein